MELTRMVEEALETVNVFNSRNIIEDVSLGMLAAGRVQKDHRTGSHMDITANSYHGIWVLSGTGRYVDADYSITVKPGDFIQRLPGVTHSTIIESDDWYEVYVLIGTDLYETLKTMNVLTEEVPVIRPGLDVDLMKKYIQICRELESAKRHELGLVVPLIIDYFADVHHKSKVRNITSEEQKTIQVAVTYMKEHIRVRLPVQEVAAYVNVGYENFRKIFTKHYGISPGNYMIQQRIHKAESLLSEGMMSVKEVALYLGYIDSFTFSKQFKKVTGRTPSAFKRLFIG